MSVGLVRCEYTNASMSSICTSCGADIVVSTFDGADDFCPACAMTRIKNLERAADDLEHDMKDLQREADSLADAALGEDDERVLYVVTAQRAPRGRERRARVRRFVVMADTDSHARVMARERLGEDGWSMEVAAQYASAIELGAA